MVRVAIASMVVGIKIFVPLQIFAACVQPVPVGNIVSYVRVTPTATFIDVIVAVPLTITIIIPAAIDVTKPRIASFRN